MDDRLVKGTMLLDQARMIRGNKELSWDSYLQPADWEVINQTILPASWYPLEVYERCGWAAFQLIARGDVEQVRTRGRIRGRELFETSYSSVVTGRDPMRALDRFVRAYSLLFNFSTLRLEQLGERHARIRHEYDPVDARTLLPYCYQLMGHFDALIELAGGSSVRIELVEKRWEGDSSTVFDIWWS